MPFRVHYITPARLRLLIALLLVCITLIAYWNSPGCKFIECFDDEDYVLENSFIAKGFTMKSLAWAFSTYRCTNWHPLTWLSHIADYQVYGLDPRGHHVTNILFHVANTLVLFLVLSRMTGAVWRSGFVAALFAVHPLHVESVAWVAERKDVLSTLFWFLTIWAYVCYATRPRVLRYVPVVMAFGLGLMAKPMLVSVPLVLLLLDYWPLQRANLKWRLLLEKLPLLVMSAGSCAITIIAQRSGGAVVGIGDLPVEYRIGNALVSYVKYLLKMLWPSHLAVQYPHPGTALPIWQPIVSLGILVALTVMFIRYRKRQPYLAAGWLWYLITLLPVIGLMQVGAQAMADRYTYVSLLGPFIMLAWGVPDLLGQSRTALRRPLSASAAVLIVVLMVCTWYQVRVWRDTYTLFTHAIKVTHNNASAYCNRGVWLFRQWRYAEAIEDLRKALEIDPTYREGRYDLALALISNGSYRKAADHLLKCLSSGLDTPALRHNLALAYYKLGNLSRAAEECEAALNLDPTFAGAHSLLAAVLYQQNQIDAAISEWRTAARLDPSLAEPHNNLARAYAAKGQYEAAWREVHRYAALGGQQDPQFIADLSKHMPDPGP